MDTIKSTVVLALLMSVCGCGSSAQPSVLQWHSVTVSDSAHFESEHPGQVVEPYVLVDIQGAVEGLPVEVRIFVQHLRSVVEVCWSLPLITSDCQEIEFGADQESAELENDASDRTAPEPDSAGDSAP